MYLTVLPLDADFNEDEVQNFDLDYFDDTVHEPISGVCDQADYNPAPTDFDASFDPVLGLTDALRASFSDINVPTSQPVGEQVKPFDYDFAWEFESHN